MVEEEEAVAGREDVVRVRAGVDMVAVVEIDVEVRVAEMSGPEVRLYTLYMGGE